MITDCSSGKRDNFYFSPLIRAVDTYGWITEVSMNPGLRRVDRRVGVPGPAAVEGSPPLVSGFVPFFFFF